MDIPTEDVKWLTVNSLGMNDFYPYVDIRAKGKNYISSALCPHEMFLKSLTLLVEESESYLCSKAKIDSSIRDVEEKDLIPLFEGVYPLAFRSFAKYGIYVFKFFIN